jgi:hypothetical protein
MEATSSAAARIEVKGYTLIVDKEDEPRVKSLAWQLSPSKSGRMHFTNGFVGRLSRWLVDAPDDMHVDHRNGNTLDNRKSNLRVCTHQQNQWNRKRAPGVSRFKGVAHWKNGLNGRVWRARIEKDGQRHFLGDFPTQLAAALAYDAAAIELFGEFAAPNFPERFRARSK